MRIGIYKYELGCYCYMNGGMIQNLEVSIDGLMGILALGSFIMLREMPCAA